MDAQKFFSDASYIQGLMLEGLQEELKDVPPSPEAVAMVGMLSKLITVLVVAMKGEEIS